MKSVFTGLNLTVVGHLRINEYDSLNDYKDRRPARVLLNRRNAIHKDNAAILIVNALSDRTDGHIRYMAFGNGGTTIDATGTVTFKAPNDTGINRDLYNPTFFELVDDIDGALPGNSMAVRHIANSYFADIDIRCYLNATIPFGQSPSNTIPNITENTTFGPIHSQFSFDEIGLKLADSTLVSHVIFTPIIKTANSILEVIYTIRVAIGQMPAPPPPLNVGLTGVSASTAITPITHDRYRIHAVRIDDNPYFADMPQPISLVDSQVGSLSVWVRGSDIFNMVHDLSPGLISSNARTTMDISGRGYVRRNPTAITRANPCQITIPNHGLATDDTVEFTIVTGGCSELQGLTETLTVIDTNNFTVPVDSSGFAAPYTGPAQLTFPTANAPPPNTMRISFRDDDTNPTSVFEWYGPEQIPLDQWVNLLISWDMNHTAGNKILQIYVNDTAWTSTSDPTYRYDPSGAFSIKYTSTPQWTIGIPVYPTDRVQITQIVREVLYPRTP